MSRGADNSTTAIAIRVFQVTTISRELAKEELAKFFSLAAESSERMGMFSPYIDNTWHQMEQDGTIDGFAIEACGRPVSHNRWNAGPAFVPWVAQYQEKYGDLPSIWFADEDGKVHEDAYADYCATREVIASWDCNPSTSSSGSKDAPPKQA